MCSELYDLLVAPVIEYAAVIWRITHSVALMQCWIYIDWNIKKKGNEAQNRAYRFMEVSEFTHNCAIH